MLCLKVLQTAQPQGKGSLPFENTKNPSLCPCPPEPVTCHTWNRGGTQTTLDRGVTTFTSARTEPAGDPQALKKHKLHVTFGADCEAQVWSPKGGEPEEDSRCCVCEVVTSRERFSGGGGMQHGSLTAVHSQSEMTVGSMTV